MVAKGQPPSLTEKADVVEVEDEPSHHATFTNSSVRIFEVNIPAGHSTLYHRHRRDNFAVVLTDAEAFSQEFGEPDGTPTPRQAGKLYFSEASGDGYVHRVVVSKNRSYRLIDVELLQPASHRALATNPDARISLENERVRAFTFQLTPGASTPPMTLSDGVLIVLPGSVIEQIADGGEVVRVDGAERPWQWRKEGKYSLRNVSSEGTIVVQLEIK